ncbi:LysE family translocator [Kitasatospora sp. NPDC057223]|uniref:LysE family translocator n=1 Tax=Kitasatospora sp. NPDC057223 TaxID=3346055 RepID=UPI00362EA04D
MSAAVLAAACSAAYLGSCAAVIATPGPDAVLVTGLVRRHRRRGPALAAAAGMITAGAGHAALAVTGVAALLSALPAVLTGLRVAGAALLLWWGLRAVHGAWAARGAAGSQGEAGTGESGAFGRSFLLGFASTGTNPKVGLFLLAFLPQFVPAGAAPGPAMALLAAVYLSMGALWLLVLTESAHRLGRWLARRRPAAAHGRAARVPDAVVGLVFVALAARLLIAP